MSDELVRLVKSGGPVTPEGKARSARNAVKHGLRASAVVIPGESAEEWIAHRDGVVAALAPANALEESLVERIAEISWRMRRVAPAEAAGITKHARMFSSDTRERMQTGREQKLPAAEWVALSALRPWKRNPRKNKEAISAVASSRTDRRGYSDIPRANVPQPAVLSCASFARVSRSPRERVFS